MKAEASQISEPVRKVTSKKEQVDWRAVTIKLGAFAATAFLGGVASAAGARAFHAAARSLKGEDTESEGNVFPINRVV